MPENRSEKHKRLQPKFLNALATGLSVSGAAKVAGLSHSQVYVWRKQDPEFAAAWMDAIESGTDVLEDVAVERARRSSDTLLIFMLKARRPEKYRETLRQEISGPNGGPVESSHEIDLSKLSDKQIAALKDISKTIRGESASD